MRLAATTEGLSRLLIGTSVIPPLMLVLIGQQISKPVCWLYALLDKTSVGRYSPISPPFVGSQSRQFMSFRSGMYWPTIHPILPLIYYPVQQHEQFAESALW